MNFLVVDTREQNPLKFNNTKNLSIITEKLSFGDYGLKINDKLICVFERKSPTDLFISLTKEHRRFRDEILRAKESKIPFFIAVEETYNNIINKNFEGAYNIKKMKGYILAKIIHTFSIKYDVQFLFFNGREEMKNYIRDFFSGLTKNETV